MTKIKTNVQHFLNMLQMPVSDMEIGGQVYVYVIYLTMAFLVAYLILT